MRKRANTIWLLIVLVCIVLGIGIWRGVEHLRGDDRPPADISYYDQFGFVDDADIPALLVEVMAEENITEVTDYPQYSITGTLYSGEILEP